MWQLIASMVARASRERAPAAPAAERALPQRSPTAPRTPPQPAHGPWAETARKALLVAVQALGINAERVQEAERKQAEAERERDVVVGWLLGELDDAGVGAQDMLVLAAAKGSNAVVAELLKDDDVDKDGEGSEALVEEGLEGKTGLYAAAYNGNEAVVEVLLTAGCSVDLPANDGVTPLMGAAMNNYAGTVKLLLEAGADKDAQNAGGWTALRYAAYIARNGHEAVVEVLLAAGCSVDLPDNAGWTPLIFAALHNDAGTVKLLLEAGADKTLVNGNERTALSYAEENGHDAVAALLRG